ncbi:synaptotagmin-5-like [Amphiura filiformis]|uniref:synaptotagmin-5-like n=1 Tax=Amphiura filiformis TaxID=82378 RepID=UPI003B210319
MASPVVLAVLGALAACIVVVCIFYLYNKHTEYPCTGAYAKKDPESIPGNVAFSQPPQEFFIPKGEKVTIQPGASRITITHQTSQSSISSVSEVNGHKHPESPHPRKQGDIPSPPHYRRHGDSPSPPYQRKQGGDTPSPVEHPESSPSPPSDPERQSITSQSSIMSHSSFDSDIGAVKPELYARKDEKLVLSHNGEPVKGSKKGPKKRGNIHVKLQYDFDKSDFIVRILEGKGLPAMDFGGSSDPYVKLWLEPDEERKIKQTAVQRRTLNPTFNEVFKFPITYEELQVRSLRLSVFDFDKFSRHDAIGDVEIKIADVDVSRELDVWSDLESPIKRHEELGDLLFSLSYLPSAERLTVVIMQARNLKTMDISGSSDPYVKVSLLQGGKRVKKKKTSVKKVNCNPVWNESLMFNVPSAALKTCSLEFVVIDYDLLGHSDKIGCVLVGPDCDGLGQQHWEDMVEQPRKPVVMWHTLQE